MFCTKCGKPIPEGSRFCPSCGNRIDAEEGGWQNPPSSPRDGGMDEGDDGQDGRKGGRKALIGILVLLLVAAVGAAGFFAIRILLDRQTEQEEIAAWDKDDGEEEEDGSRDEAGTDGAALQDEGDGAADSDGLFAESTPEGIRFVEETEASRETEHAEETAASGETAYDPSEGGIHRYGFYVEDCSWSEAFEKAQEKGGYLVHINSREEYDAILSQIEELEYGKIQFYLGSCRDEGEYAYYWRDEENRAYGERIDGAGYWCAGEWLEGEPSFSYEETQEDCINMYYNSSEGKWVWNDIPDDLLGTAPGYSGNVGYIVEYED